VIPLRGRLLAELFQTFHMITDCWKSFMQTWSHRSATTFKPLTGEVNNANHRITLQYSARKQRHSCGMPGSLCNGTYWWLRPLAAGPCVPQQACSYTVLLWRPKGPLQTLCEESGYIVADRCIFFFFYKFSLLVLGNIVLWQYKKKIIQRLPIIIKVCTGGHL